MKSRCSHSHWGWLCLATREKLLVTLRPGPATEMEKKAFFFSINWMNIPKPSGVIGLCAKTLIRIWPFFEILCLEYSITHCFIVYMKYNQLYNFSCHIFQNKVMYLLLSDENTWNQKCWRQLGCQLMRGKQIRSPVAIVKHICLRRHVKRRTDFCTVYCQWPPFLEYGRYSRFPRSRKKRPYPAFGDIVVNRAAN